jgi:hypothetical protein
VTGILRKAEFQDVPWGVTLVATDLQNTALATLAMPATWVGPLINPEAFASNSGLVGQPLLGPAIIARGRSVACVISSVRCSRPHRPERNPRTRLAREK